MAVCTYDNPGTMQRECWQDGFLVAAYSERLFTLPGPFPLPPERYFFGANVGDWKTGQLVGDRAALPSGGRNGD